MRAPLLALIALLVFGCPSRETTTTTDTVTTSGTMATGTASKTSTGARGGTASSLSASDKQFFISAAQSNFNEINLSKAEVDSATNPNVQSLANHLLADHDTLSQELQDLALKKGLALPTPVPPASLPNIDVDRAYVQRMVSDHQKAIADFSKATVQDPDLRAWAARTLPMLRDHLAKAKALSGS